MVEEDVGGRQLHILVVDDEPAHAEAIVRAFEAANPEAKVEVAGTLGEFRRLTVGVTSRQPDLVIIDLNLPDGRAVEILTTPLEEGPFPVLVMTSYGNEETAVEAMKAGAIDYVIKSPESFAAMPRKAKRALREWGLLQGRRQAREQYRVLSQEFHALLEAIPDVITLNSPDLKVIWANQRAAQAMGKKVAEVIGHHCYALWHNRVTPCEPCPVLRTFRNGEPAIDTIATLSGQVWEARTVPVKEDGRVVKVMEVARDVTESRRLEEQVRHSQKMDTIGTLAGGISHDFNNILTAILGYANLAHGALEEGSQTAKDVQQVIYAGERAKELVKQILTFSRQRAEETQPVQASLMVKEALKMLKASIPSTIEIKDRILAQGLTIMIDPTKLHQVVMNLCTNAYQAMKATGGTMLVSLEPVTFPEVGGWFGQQRVSGDYLRLAVQDTGGGMDHFTLERIFEPYFTTKSKEDGTGLGLSVVHGIVKSFKGYIDVQSTLGEGSLFQVIWPLLREAPPVNRIESATVAGGHERILLVDDEPALVNLHARALSRLGYRVTYRTSALEALELFRHSVDGFDLVITDFSMPKLDGIALSERLLAVDPGVRIILLTGFSETHSEESLARVGIKKLLLKPVVRQELAEAIRAVLDR